MAFTDFGLTGLPAAGEPALARIRTFAHRSAERLAGRTPALRSDSFSRQLDDAARTSMRVLHDRRIPRSRSAVDHIVIAPSGIYVINAKRYRAARRPRLVIERGPLRGGSERLAVGSRDCTDAVEAVQWRRSHVETALYRLGDIPGVPVHAVLCLIDADWSLIGGDLTIQDVSVVGPRTCLTMLARPGPLAQAAVDRVYAHLGEHFPAAAAPARPTLPA